MRSAAYRADSPIRNEQAFSPATLADDVKFLQRSNTGGKKPVTRYQLPSIFVFGTLVSISLRLLNPYPLV
jgi:hypothetical protein